MPGAKKKSASARKGDAKARAAEVAAALAQSYPDADCALTPRDPFQLLAATILSAQCTDERVNAVTPVLFRRAATPAAMAATPVEEIEDIIRSTGFFRNKAKHLKAMAEAIEREHGGVVPRDLEALTKLPGVGRKTANVVLGVAFGTAVGVVVDTHVKRLCGRLGLTESRDPVKIERDLMAALPPSEWVAISHRLIAHGRAACRARKPDCPRCPLAALCPRRGVA